MNKIHNIELRLYELLGVKIFRKLVFYIPCITCLPKVLKLPKKERRQFIFSIPSNYRMKHGHGLQDVKNFRKWIILNSICHLYGLYVFINTFLIFGGITTTSSLFVTAFCLFWGVINSYCLMLQRYN